MTFASSNIGRPMTIYLIRHGSAGTRGQYPGDDFDRPLDQRGTDQAEEIVKLLADSELDLIISSPATRCVETVQPLAEHVALPVEEHPALVEGHGPGPALALIRQLAHAGTTAALCTHGDVLPDVIEALVRAGAVIEGPQSWEKGCTWQLEVGSGTVVGVSLLTRS